MIFLRCLCSSKEILSFIVLRMYFHPPAEPRAVDRGVCTQFHAQILLHQQKRKPETSSCYFD